MGDQEILLESNKRGREGERDEGRENRLRMISEVGGEKKRREPDVVFEAPPPGDWESLDIASLVSFVMELGCTSTFKSR